MPCHADPVCSLHATLRRSTVASTPSPVDSADAANARHTGPPTTPAAHRPAPARRVGPLLCTFHLAENRDSREMFVWRMGLCGVRTAARDPLHQPRRVGRNAQCARCSGSGGSPRSGIPRTDGDRRQAPLLRRGKTARCNGLVAGQRDVDPETPVGRQSSDAPASRARCSAARCAGCRDCPSTFPARGSRRSRQMG